MDKAWSLSLSPIFILQMMMIEAWILNFCFYRCTRGVYICICAQEDITIISCCPIHKPPEKKKTGGKREGRKKEGLGRRIIGLNRSESHETWWSKRASSQPNRYYVHKYYDWQMPNLVLIRRQVGKRILKKAFLTIHMIITVRGSWFWWKDIYECGTKSKAKAEFVIMA